MFPQRNLNLVQNEVQCDPGSADDRWDCGQHRRPARQEKWVYRQKDYSFEAAWITHKSHESHSSRSIIIRYTTEDRQYLVPGMVYYQQPAAAEWYGGAPQQRFMYMQYVQPGRTHARSTQAASALVAGETVATGTYLKGKQPHQSC